MDIDNILTFPRWRILEIVSNKPSSPLEISNQLQTSMAYVSQQLKLLEAANLVKKSKTGNVAKGEPRFLFSITKDILHMTVLTNNFSTKKLIALDERSKILLRIWLVDSPELRYSLERVYWAIERELPKIQGLFLEEGPGKKHTLLIVGEPSAIKSRVNSLSGQFEDLLSIIVSKEQRKLSEKAIPIYVPNTLNVGKIMKGGSD